MKVTLRYSKMPENYPITLTHCCSLTIYPILIHFEEHAVCYLRQIGYSYLYV